MRDTIETGYYEQRGGHRRTKVAGLVTAAFTLFVGLAVAPAHADDESRAAAILECFHPRDRHMDTSCDQAVGGEAKAKSECDSSPVTVRQCTTSYRGSITNTLYRMRTETKVKYVCGTAGDGRKVRQRWVKVLNVGDQWQPVPCELENWTLASTEQLSAPPAQTVNDGSDADRPSLAPSDDGFVDQRGGWGWGDRCWTHIKAGKLGWARAACLRGMYVADTNAQQPRASLLYNLGVIAKGARHYDQARSYFVQSLALREHPEVRAALNSLP